MLYWVYNNKENTKEDSTLTELHCIKETEINTSKAHTL